MATQQISSLSDLPTRSTFQKQYTRPLPLRAQTTEEKLSRNPFDSPNLSLSSLNETDSGSTSGLDEFHLERYSNNARSKHLRDMSRSTNGDEKQRPDLNIITTFTIPHMPMNSDTVKINEVQAKQTGTDRKLKALSVVSHKAIQSTASPLDPEGSSFPIPRSKMPQVTKKSSKRSKPIQKLQKAMTQRQMSPFTQRIPIGITIPKTHAAMVDQSGDSAFPGFTPLTPAIVVTPAGENVPWVLQRRGTSEKGSASSAYSPMPSSKFGHNPDIPPTPRTADLENVYTNEKVMYRGTRTSQDSSELILPDSSESARPKSQGWWNVMLSPLLRAGSVASRMTRQPTDTPPVPPIPFAREKTESPALSARSDPSFLVSPHETDPSPDTPRRQGLASARASTWSRWTEWENEREAGRQSEEEEEVVDQRDLNTEIEGSTPMPAREGPGLAAEYFHACAVEQLTGRPYFECINHDCAEQAPKLQSICDLDKTKFVTLGSPFDETKGLNLQKDIKSPDGTDIAQSPSVFSDALSPNELSPNVRQASVVPVLKPRALDSSSDKGFDTKDICDPVRSPTDKAPSPIAPPTYTANKNNDDLPNIATVTQAGPPRPQIIEIQVTHQTPPPPPAFEAPSEKVPVAQEVPAEKTYPAPEPLSEKVAAFGEPLASPGPISPDGQKSLAPSGAVPLSSMNREAYPAPIVYDNYSAPSQLPLKPTFITAETEYPPLPERAPTAPVTVQDLDQVSAPRRLSIEEQRRRLEKEDATASRLGNLWRGRGCFPEHGCMGRGGREGRTKRRWVIGISLALLIIIIASIVLAVTLTRHGDGTPVQSEWLNLTGYPAMPTGIMTIATPNLVAQEKRCVAPSTMWSCAVPKEDRNEIGSNDPNQPNFRFEITFRNGTVPVNMTIPVNDLGKRASNPFTNDIFVPNPSPPNQGDQIFIGNTTDNITTPFDGEQTPFFISFMPTFPTLPAGFNDSSAKRLVRRQSTSSNSSLLRAIPAPELADDGSAAPASLLPTTPYPISQQVRLYNRGSQDEHYGFYMYYEKSIYLSGFSLNATGGLVQDSLNPIDADQDGGSTKATAAARCSFAQTRFLFKIFTSAQFDGGLLSGVSNATNPDEKKKGSSTNSATNFVQPGSFPYPASIVLDRHGGDFNTKAAWCYGMSNGQILKDRKILVGEDRAFGGMLINAAPSLVSGPDGFNETAGGIDGGTGGCGCTWQNWQ